MRSSSRFLPRLGVRANYNSPFPRLSSSDVRETAPTAVDGRECFTSTDCSTSSAWLWKPTCGSRPEVTRTRPDIRARFRYRPSRTRVRRRTQLTSLRGVAMQVTHARLQARFYGSRVPPFDTVPRPECPGQLYISHYGMSDGAKLKRLGFYVQKCRLRHLTFQPPPDFTSR
jgi:hypothetical protein